MNTSGTDGLFRRIAQREDTDTTKTNTMKECEVWSGASGNTRCRKISLRDTVSDRLERILFRGLQDGTSSRYDQSQWLDGDKAGLWRHTDLVRRTASGTCAPHLGAGKRATKHVTARIHTNWSINKNKNKTTTRVTPQANSGESEPTHQTAGRWIHGVDWHAKPTK